MTRVRAALRRQDFVDAAVDVIATHGVAGATTRRIAQAAGCPLASLHYVFHTALLQKLGRFQVD
ncbi:TetR family transcriptional regulator [Paraburkholderia sp. A2RI-6]|uniref:TetR family transcriptional regulator n=1 Tax=Paraburkholderia sp. A2RI-6 TaxID=3028371 RepID=UPI003B819F4A